MQLEDIEVGAAARGRGGGGGGWGEEEEEKEFETSKGNEHSNLKRNKKVNEAGKLTEPKSLINLSHQRKLQNLKLNRYVTSQKKKCPVVTAQIRKTWLMHTKKCNKIT
jgi:hypothetical protein